MNKMVSNRSLMVSLQINLMIKVQLNYLGKGLKLVEIISNFMLAAAIIMPP